MYIQFNVYTIQCILYNLMYIIQFNVYNIFQVNQSLHFVMRDYLDISWFGHVSLQYTTLLYFIDSGSAPWSRYSSGILKV